MKKILYLTAFAVLTACTSGSPDKTQADDTASTGSEQDRAIGFNTMLPDLKWHLGTEDAIKVVEDLDEAWKKKDYDAMRTFFADTATMYFPDGRVAKSGDEAIKMIEAEDKGLDVSWTSDYAFSVDLDPSKGGEHVQAGFTVTVKDGDTVKKERYHEWYYIVDGKIVSLWQFTQDIPPGEDE